MSGPLGPILVGATGLPAQSLPGFDATPVIAAGEQRLRDYLATPTQQILEQLGQQRFRDQEAPAPAGQELAAHPGGTIHPMDPSQLISPVAQALGTLGTGMFDGTNPASMFDKISRAFDDTSGAMRQALGAAGQGWQGAAHAAAVAKTNAALTNGADIATQASMLGASLSTAVADVGQARTRLIAIINHFADTVAAIGINIIFPWGWAAVLAAAAQAVAQAAEVITETQGALAAQAGVIMAIAAPIAVAAAPQLASMAASALPVAMQLGTAGVGMTMEAGMAGISPIMSAVTSAANTAGAGSANTGTLVDSTTSHPSSPPRGGTPPSKPGGPTPSVSPPVTPVSASIAPLPRMATPPTSTTAPTTATVPVGSTRPAAASAPVGGAGMMGAPPAGASNSAGGGAHTAAAFLHTTDQGGKVVGNRTTVAPPVIGEADPHETPDIELRI